MKKIKYSFKDWCLDNNHQDWLDLWDYDLNDCKPEDIAYQSAKKIYFKCSKGLHPSESKKPNNIVNTKKLRCNRCNSFGQWLLDNLGDNAIKDYWSEKNTIDPFSIDYGSNKKIFVKCQNGCPDYPITPCNFRIGNRCPVCAGKIVIAEINSVAAKHPELVDYFVNKNDAYTHTSQCKLHLPCRCPFCGHIKDIAMYNLVNTGFACPICSDGISYPNKFMSVFLHLLLQNKCITFKTEKYFEWSKNTRHEIPKLCGDKKYDFYIELSEPIIIECHGDQHYNPNRRKGKRKRTLFEEQENDKFKQQLALSNGILKNRYIVLDCRVSKMSFIKESIMNSNLPNLLDFCESDINWELCGKIASKSLVVCACELWNEEIYNISDIANQLKISVSTVSRYLKQGSEIGMCNYVPIKGKHIETHKIIT